MNAGTGDHAGGRSRGTRRGGATRRPSRAALFYEFSRALAVSDSAGEGRLRALQVAAQSLGAEFVAYWSVLPGSEALRLVDDWEEPELQDSSFVARSRELRLESGRGLAGRVLESGEAEWLTDVASDDNFPRANEAQESGLASGFAVPVASGGRVVGVLELLFQRSMPRDDGLLNTMAAVGGSLGQLIERKRAEDALHESEALKAAILDSAADAIVTLDSGDRVIEFNRAAERLFGVSADAALGRPIEGLAIPAGLREAVDSDSAAVGPAETQLQRQDGTTLSVAVTLARVARSDARLYTVNIRDVTAEKRFGEEQAFLARVSDELARSLDYEATLRLVAMLAVPFLADLAIIDAIDEDGALERVAVSVSSEQAERTAAEMLHAPVRYDVGDPREKAIRDGRPVILLDAPEELTRELRLVGDGEPADGRGPLGCIIVPLRARGTTHGVLTLVASPSFRQYTERDVALAQEMGRRVAFAVSNARMFAAAQRTAEEMRRLAQAKDEFLGLVSHELRTPLTTILGNASSLNRHWERLERDSLTQALEDIESEGRRLAALVENMLALSRLETVGEVETEPVLLQRLTPHIIATHRARFAGRAVQVELPADLPPVAAAPDLFEQILLNLVSNAHKYSPEGNPIEVTAEVGDEVVVVCVRDHGPGIASEDIDHIFEPFFRSRRTADRASGAGLGLAVTRRLVELQQGSIGVECPPGGGTAMSFSLPVQE